MEPTATDQTPLFPPIGDNEPAEPKDETTLEPHEVKIKELKEKLDEQGKKMEKQNEDFMKLLATRPTPAQPAQIVQQTPAQEEVKMPDVLEDPEGYAKFVNDQAMANAKNYVNQETSQLKTKYEEDKKYERVFGRFKTIDPDVYDKNSKFIEFIAVQKVKDAVTQGIDVNTFIFGNEEQFAQDVMSEAKQQLGINKIEDNDRTAGLITTPTLSTTPVKKDENIGSFMKSLKDLHYRGR